MIPIESISKQDQASGSPSSGEPEFLAVGLLRRPHGIQGEIKMTVWTDFPERLEPGSKVYVGNRYDEVTIRSIRWQNEDILISFEEYQTRESVGLLRNQAIMVLKTDIPPLEDGEFYLHEFVGLKVVIQESGKTLGRIDEIIETGANDVFIVRNLVGKEFLVPDIDDVILEVDIEKKMVQINLLPGLLEIDD